MKLSELKFDRDFERFLSYLRQEIVGIKSGIKGLDDQLLGLQGFVGLIGEPKCCKSSFALQVALYNAMSGIPACLIDCENGAATTKLRALCSLTKKSMSTIRQFPDEKIATLNTGFTKLPFFYNSGPVSLEIVGDLVAQMDTMYPGKKKVLIVDSLQAIQTAIRDLRLSVDEWLVGLDGLKLKYDPNLVILLTVEKRRGSYGQAQKDAAKESGRIEYKLECQLDMRSTEDDDIILECTTNRHGPIPAPIRMKKLYENAADPRSFIFTLAERETQELPE